MCRYAGRWNARWWDGEVHVADHLLGVNSLVVGHHSDAAGSGLLQKDLDNHEEKHIRRQAGAEIHTSRGCVYQYVSQTEKFLDFIIKVSNITEISQTVSPHN